MVACEKQPEWDEVGNGWGWCRGHQHHCWRPISPQLSRRSLTYADTPLFDSCIRSSRLPSSFFYICIIKHINPNVKQFSWAINYICFLCPQFFWDVARLGNLISIVYIYVTDSEWEYRSFLGCAELRVSYYVELVCGNQLSFYCEVAVMLVLIDFHNLLPGWGRKGKYNEGKVVHSSSSF